MSASLSKANMSADGFNVCSVPIGDIQRGVPTRIDGSREVGITSVS
jgi:hypothetical protein